MALNSEKCLIWALSLKALLLSNVIHFFSAESHGGPKEVMKINRNLKIFVAAMEAHLPHKYTSEICAVEILQFTKWQDACLMYQAPPIAAH